MILDEKYLKEKKSWFREYLRQFGSLDKDVQAAFSLKAQHSLRVCDLAEELAPFIFSDSQDVILAAYIGLIHDIGRFEQYHTYGSFADRDTVDHAWLAQQVLSRLKVLQDFDSNTIDLINFAILNHNRYSIENHSDPRFIIFAQFLRDVDKIDIFYFVHIHYQQDAIGQGKKVVLDLPDLPRINPAVMAAIMEERQVAIKDLRTLNDFKLLQIGWVYDINFVVALKVIHEKKYLDTIFRVLPDTAAVRDICKKINHDITVRLDETKP
ncbi:MAG: HD domain-containing protein [Candidatus Omnitrophica bacterium]|nr:HD domain-containing protein [Candidatus Omnitrophota bacterium]